MSYLVAKACPYKVCHTRSPDICFCVSNNAGGVGASGLYPSPFSAMQSTIDFVSHGPKLEAMRVVPMVADVLKC